MAFLAVKFCLHCLYISLFIPSVIVEANQDSVIHVEHLKNIDQKDGTNHDFNTKNSIQQLNTKITLYL